MSLNYFQSGNRVIMVGWVKPTQRAFLTARDLTSSRLDWREPLLVEVDYTFDRVNCLHHVDEIILAMKSKLAVIGVHLSSDIYTHVVQDITTNSVNVCRIHYLDKEPQLHNGSPLLDGLFAN